MAMNLKKLSLILIFGVLLGGCEIMTQIISGTSRYTGLTTTTYTAFKTKGIEAKWKSAPVPDGYAKAGLTQAFLFGTSNNNPDGLNNRQKKDIEEFIRFIGNRDIYASIITLLAYSDERYPDRNQESLKYAKALRSYLKYLGYKGAIDIEIVGFDSIDTRTCHEKIKFYGCTKSVKRVDLVTLYVAPDYYMDREKLEAMSRLIDEYHYQKRR